MIVAITTASMSVLLDLPRRTRQARSRPLRAADKSTNLETMPWLSTRLAPEPRRASHWDRTLGASGQLLPSKVLSPGPRPPEPPPHQRRERTHPWVAWARRHRLGFHLLASRSVVFAYRKGNKNSSVLPDHRTKVSASVTGSVVFSFGARQRRNLVACLAVRKSLRLRTHRLESGTLVPEPCEGSCHQAQTRAQGDANSYARCARDGNTDCNSSPSTKAQTNAGERLNELPVNLMPIRVIHHESILARGHCLKRVTRFCCIPSHPGWRMP